MERVEWTRSRKAGLRMKQAGRRFGAAGRARFYADWVWGTSDRVRRIRSTLKPIGGWLMPRRRRGRAFPRPSRRDFYQFRLGAFRCYTNPPASLALHRLKALGYDEFPF